MKNYTKRTSNILDTDFNYQLLYDRLYSMGYHSDGKNIAKNYVDYICENHNFNSIIDCGCSNGEAVKALRSRSKLARGVDVSSLAIKSKFCEQMSLLKLDFPDDKFDAVLSCDVLEHLKYKDLGKALKEINRVASKYLFLSVSKSVEGQTEWIERLHTQQEFLEIENLHLTVRPLDWWIIIIEGFGKFRLYDKYKKLLIFTRDGKDDN